MSVVHRLLAMTVLIAVAMIAVAQEESAPSVQATASVQKQAGYAPVNGLRMYYEISGDGPPAVFIHPIVSHCGLMPAMGENRRWIAMDLQGHGRTPDIDRPMTCEQHADDIAALLRHLGVSRADFFGDSFGGAIAMTVAVRHPEIVKRVGVYGSPLTPLPKDIGATFGPESDLVKWEREEYRKVSSTPDHWPLLFEKALRSGIDWKGLTLDQLKGIQSPVLIACGDHDLIPVERCLELSRQIPNSQLAVIPDASHFVLFSEPERLRPIVSHFFDASASRPPLSTFRTGYYPDRTR